MKKLTTKSPKIFFLLLIASLNALASTQKDSNFITCILPVEAKKESNTTKIIALKEQDKAKKSKYNKIQIKKFISKLEAGSALLTPVSAVLIITLFILLL